MVVDQDRVAPIASPKYTPKLNSLNASLKPIPPKNAPQKWRIPLIATKAKHIRRRCQRH